MHLLLWILIICSEAFSEALIHSYEIAPVIAKAVFGQGLNALLFYCTALLIFPRPKPWSGLGALAMVLIAPVLSYAVYMSIYHWFLGVEFMTYSLELYLYYLTNGILFVLAGYLYGGARNAIALEKKQAQLEREQALAEARFLRTKLNPHFLFNALNTLLSLSLHQQKQLPETLLRLAGILRYNLENRERFLVAVQEEIGPLEDYLFVQQQRLLKDFPVDTWFRPLNPNFEIPIFSLINLVENCFKHGDLSRQGWIKLRLRSTKNYLYFSADNKIGSQSAESPGSNLGLESLKKQLELNFPEHYRFERREDGERFQIRILIWH